MRLAERDDLTPEQRFFVGFAQWACANERPENMRVNAIVDPHSPPRCAHQRRRREHAGVRRRLQCKASAKLVKKPEDLCKVW